MMGRGKCPIGTEGVPSRSFKMEGMASVLRMTGWMWPWTMGEIQEEMTGEIVEEQEITDEVEMTVASTAMAWYPGPVGGVSAEICTP